MPFRSPASLGVLVSFLLSSSLAPQEGFPLVTPGFPPEKLATRLTGKGLR